MYKPLLICIISVLILLWGSGCKNAGPDSNWVGVYSSTNPGDSLSSLIITSNGSSSLKIEIKAQQSGYIYLYTTLQHVTVSSVTQAVINESENITGNTGVHDIQGNLTLTGSMLTLTATATQGTDVKNLSFTGRKH